ncbi:MAG: radical SAM protein [Alphaproteobacteria bacterium]|nr:radical SAM protein [Alphaproteobacteria bacterium]
MERISIELSRRCEKACAFCYNHSGPEGDGVWTLDTVVAFVTDCARHGTRFVSFGGGEPLEWPPLWALLARLEGVVYRSLTTNGLRLDGAMDDLVAARPDKVHVSIHFPDRGAEVRRVVRQVAALEARGVPSGVNLMVDARQLDAARGAMEALSEAGVGPERIVLLPRRGDHTPTPAQLAVVAGTPRFRSMSCLLACGPSPRFVSIDAQARVAWCSYTETRRALPTLDHVGLRCALAGLGLRFCGPEALRGSV